MAYTMDVTKNIDLENLGLLKTVNENIRRNRKSDVAIRVRKADGTPVTNAEISLKQTESAFRFGCNAFMVNQFESQADNEAYTKAFKKLFNQAVVPFYWRDDEPEKGKYRFEAGSPYIYRRPPADTVLEWCEKQKIEPKSHNMIWLNESVGLPSWMPKDKTGMQKTIDDRIRMLAEKYASKIPVWDVCNEVADAGTYEDMPEDFEVKAHILADKLFPDCHLIYNDYYGFYNETFRGKRSVTYQIIKKILAAGGRIDGIGIQHHMFIKEEEVSETNNMLNAEHILNMLNIYSNLADALHYSEITIPSYDSTPEKLAVQEKIVENIYRLWFSVKEVQSIVWWNLADGYAFVNPENPSWNEDYYGGGLLNHDFSEKPAYKVLNRLINEEWKTNETLILNENGSVNAEMFHGTYDITVQGKAFHAAVDENTSVLTFVLN